MFSIFLLRLHVIQKAVVDVGGDLARQSSDRMRLLSDLEPSSFNSQQDSGLVGWVAGRVEEVDYRCDEGEPSPGCLLNESC